MRKAQQKSQTPKVKYINIGWKHKRICEKKYSQRKNVKNGNSRELQLDHNKVFTVQDIIKLGIKEYENDQVAKFTLENCEVKLGFYSGSIIEGFNLANGTECGLWDYLAYKNINGRINLYLHSSENEDFADKLIDLWDNEDIEDKNSDDVSCSPPKRMALSNITNTSNDSNIAHVESLDSKPSDIQNCNLRDSQNSTTEIVSEKSTSNLKSIDIGTASSNKDDSSIALSALLELANSVGTENNNGVVNIVNSTENKGSNVLQTMIPNFEETAVEPNNSCTRIVFDRNFRRADVYYAVVSTSQYTNEKTISKQDKSSIFFNDFQNQEFNNIDKENFDPVDNGYDIGTIFIDGHEILSMKYDVVDNFSVYRNYVFPQLEKNEPHTIAYDIDHTLGSYEEYLGMGVIPTCLEDCNPDFTWYCNNEIFKKFKMAFWLQIPKSSIDTEWYCIVSCKEKRTLESKKVLIKANIFENSCVSEVKRSDFTIDTFIGSGSTANIFQGKFSNKTVAIKSIKVYPRYKNLIDREISILKKIKHDNVIYLMGYCKEAKQVHFILEYFNSNNLHDVIFDDELKKKYVFDKNRKDSTFLQLSSAIQYLHGQSNPIIHKDIKSENVLINESGRVKLCDFGLSKFSIMITTLQSTINSKVMGTKMYMAPEILLNKKDATKESDIWLLACTILEIYKEDVVWDVESEDELLKLLKSNALPDMEKVPINYTDILRCCFSYERTNRPSIMEIVSVLDSIFMRTLRSYINPAHAV